MDYPLIHQPKDPAITLPQIQSVVVGEEKFIRQGESEHYGHVILQLEPNPERNGCFMLWSVAENTIPEFFLEVVYDTIPEFFLEDVYEGLCEAMCEEPEKHRYRHGYIPFPYENTNVRIISGSYHEANSRSASFRMAASLALAEAVSKL